jgi:hypothetical protein
VIGGTLLLSAASGRVDWEAAVLAVGSSVGLAAIDVYFVTTDVIPRVYLADAAAEALLVLWWLVVVARGKERPLP